MAEDLRYNLNEIAKAPFKQDVVLTQSVRTYLTDEIPSRVDQIEDAIDLCYGLGLTAGWWHDKVTKEPKPDREFGQLCALFHSEISEAFEAYRTDAMDDKLPEFPGQLTEIADVIIRLFDWLGQDEERKAVFLQAMSAKLVFNTKRKDHTMEARNAEGGKKI